MKNALDMQLYDLSKVLGIVNNSKKATRLLP